MSREPLEAVVQSEKVSQIEREKILLSKSALNFARRSGLDVGQSYQHYIKVPSDAISYTVQAARPTELKLRTWWFPVVGSVPYLGFFDAKDRDEEALTLEKAGYEVHRGAVAAYSSLGWFADPIYSSMLRRGDADLVHLYFHELTHRTLWLKDGVEFNENLAEFVADVLTKEFFSENNRLREIDELKVAKADYRLFKDWLSLLRIALNNYLDSTKDRPDHERIAEKNKLIDMAIQKKPKFIRIDYVGSAKWNNARILAAGLYSPDTSAFEQAARCYVQDKMPSWVGNFLKSLKKKAESESDGFSALKAMCVRQ